MPLPPLAGPLRYLIGGDDTYRSSTTETVEWSYDSQHGATRYGTLTSEKERFRSLAQADQRGMYRPYLPPSDITAGYGEWCPDPRANGFMRNVRLQVDRVAGTGGERIELDNPDFEGLPLRFVLQAHDYAWSKGLRTIAKNPLNVSDPERYASHPSIDLCVVERGDHGSDAMEALRRDISQPLLAVRFVGYRAHGQNDLAWCNAVAARIAHKGYRNMGVTFSHDGEYTSSEDIQEPLP